MTLSSGGANFSECSAFGTMPVPLLKNFDFVIVT